MGFRQLDVMACSTYYNVCIMLSPGPVLNSFYGNFSFKVQRFFDGSNEMILRTVKVPSLTRNKIKHFINTENKQNCAKNNRKRSKQAMQFITNSESY